ncbi:CHAT domain-containing protein [Oscillatoria sp. FACHB-1406]|uniref:CHAT domain-containing protein n=1 Tax=Oscillatoria sp. FACHB-1406 TaxID=2692846 RepID=UPI001685D059|nr:CHAT domain-containing protein [Oscillatoria sp. FACHB-1406]MBD2578370.1 CHAT domain-containing protein [Oscillatoria sp. FACHB-1406]
MLFCLGVAIAIVPENASAFSSGDTTPQPETIDDWQRRSQILYQQGKYGDAIAILQSALAASTAAGDFPKAAIACINLSQVYQAVGQWQEARDAIENSSGFLPNIGGKERDKIFARLLEVRGKLELSLNQLESAIEDWKQATNIYHQLNDTTSELRCKINHSIALKESGNYREMLELSLNNAGGILQLSDSTFKATALRHLGEVIAIAGDRKTLESTPLFSSLGLEQRNELEIAEWLLQQSLTVARSLNSSQDIAESYLLLGNLKKIVYSRAKDAFERSNSKEYPIAQQIEIAKTALDFYQKAQDSSPSELTKFQANINRLSLLIDLEKQADIPLNPTPTQQIDEGLQNLNELLARLNAFPVQHQTLLFRIKLAALLIDRNLESYFPIVEQLLLETQSQAKIVNDSKISAYTEGYLGSIYQFKGQTAQSNELFRNAILGSQEVHANDLLYQWEWELSKLLVKQGQKSEAVIAYEETIKTVDSVRKELLSLPNPEVRFTFRDNVEPVYRELVSLLLSREEANIPQDDLKKALYYIDALQVAELEDFLRCNLQSKVTPSSETNSLQGQIADFSQHLEKISSFDPNSAFLYTISLPHQLATIVKLPQKQALLSHVEEIEASEFEETLQKASESSKKPNFLDTDRAPLQKLYKWSIAPFVQEFQNNGITHLVTVLDSNLRSVPMAAFHDGEKFLIERGYSLSIAPSVQLIEPKPFKIEATKTLILGATETRTGWEPLTPAVPNQIEKLSQILKNFEVISNGQFTKQALQERMSSLYYNVVHIITHGKFSSSFEETYIFTDDKSSDRRNYTLDINELSGILHNTPAAQPLELLVFSACETASGDRRAVLGMAGITIKSGANSTIGSLWKVKQDAANELMINFYKNLSDRKVSKAEALRLAQMDIITSNSKDTLVKSPGYWASLILVGF